MKKTLLLSAAALMLVSAGVATSNSVSAYEHYTNPILRQNGTQKLREEKQNAKLRIRNLLKTYNVTNTNEYNSYYNFYLRKVGNSQDISMVKQVISELKKTLQER